jgi:hypothetical protein
MDATIASEIFVTLTSLANLYYDFAVRFQIDLEIVAFVIEDEFLSSSRKIVFVNK